MKKTLVMSLLLLGSVPVLLASAYAQTPTVHVSAASGSSEFLAVALGADRLALQEISDNVANGTWTAGQKKTYHWTGSKAANLVDLRDFRILPELGNAWVVWIADSSDATGNANVTDVWTAISLDATLAVRAFSAQQTSGSGGQLQIIPGTASNLVSPKTLWGDGNSDVPTLVGVTNVINAIGTSSSGAGDIHVNVAFSSLRPEDALYATTRALATLNTTNWAGLGYKGPTVNIGAPIFSAESTLASTPVKFALSGGTDPISHKVVPAYKTIPIGAAPFIFVLNNGGAFSSSTANLITGVGTHGPFPLAHLVDGTTTADTHNAAFGGNGDAAGTPLTVILREPLSAAANVVEFTLFRSTGNATDSQEKGVNDPTRAPFNPLNLPAPVQGSRVRAIGTSEVVGTLKVTPNSIGYIAFGFANASKLSGANWNYLTLDGVDPLSIPGTTNQELPNGSVTNAPTVWPSTPSFPTLRNGTYKAWSISRAVVAATDSDPYGPSVLAQFAQDNVDDTVADFVPFHTSDGRDGLEVYRSHFPQSGVALAKVSNGAATLPNILDGGNTLGGGAEAGGDVGGAIQGPFNYAYPTANGFVSTNGTTNAVVWKSGDHFKAGAAWVGTTISINGTAYTITNPNPTTTALHVTPIPPKYLAPGKAYSVSYVSPAASAPGVINKKQ